MDCFVACAPRNDDHGPASSRHCERSEAIHVETEQGARWIASSLALLAMTKPGPRLPVIASASEAIHVETEQGARWSSHGDDGIFRQDSGLARYLPPFVQSTVEHHELPVKMCDEEQAKAYTKQQRRPWRGTLIDRLPLP
jgi:hypothetical protein